MIRAVLTIDDISSRNTPAISDFLQERGIQAVLFAVGSRIEQHPEEAVYALQHGMIVGNHSTSHPHFSDLSLSEGTAEIERCEELLDGIYAAAGVRREARPFRFPFGDKGGSNRAAFQAYLRKRGFSKLKDTQIAFPWWKENGLDRDIDTFWTFDFAEYNIREGSGFTMEDVWRRVRDPSPKSGAPLLEEGACHILLLHAHDETEEQVPGYYRILIDALLEKGVQFEKPAFLTPAKVRDGA